RMSRRTVRSGSFVSMGRPPSDSGREEAASRPATSLLDLSPMRIAKRHDHIPFLLYAGRRELDDRAAPPGELPGATTTRAGSIGYREALAAGSGRPRDGVAEQEVVLDALDHLEVEVIGDRRAPFEEVAGRRVQDERQQDQVQAID